MMMTFIIRRSVAFLFAVAVLFSYFFKSRDNIRFKDIQPTPPVEFILSPHGPEPGPSFRPCERYRLFCADIPARSAFHAQFKILDPRLSPRHFITSGEAHFDAISAPRAFVRIDPDKGAGAIDPFDSGKLVRNPRPFCRLAHTHTSKSE
jgi:hypothetical protein